MPRQPRFDVADIPQHVVQRGNDRQPCFFKHEDHERQDVCGYVTHATLTHKNGSTHEVCEDRKIATPTQFACHR